MDPPVLEARGVTCGYGADPVLHDVSFRLTPGDFVGVIGPNGCGKSTLIRALTGVLRLETGTVTLDGEDVHRMGRRQVARRVAVIPQESGHLFGFTVMEMVMMGRTPHLRRLQRAADRDVALTEAALRQTDLMGLRDRKVTELSGGERQRAVIARALAQEPGLLLLDEPDSHLDIGHQIEIFDLIASLNRDRGLTLLCVSHNLNLASAYCRQLMLMQNGRLASTGAPEEIVTPERIHEVYGIRAHVQRSPVNGAPQITPVTGLSSQAPPKPAPSP
jgi:iron complex transport system ATP-binding protein